MNISILGATGSIGRQTINVARALGIKVKAIAAGHDRKALEELAQIVKPDMAVLYEESGMEGLLECAGLPDVQLVVNAMVGSIGLKPTMAAIAAKKDIALANKETLVAAGPLVMAAARTNGVEIRPIDSEHSAIWQCLQGNDKSQVKKLILTASGGAFRTWDKDALFRATAADALRHPVWNMGKKITIDCATMMNKGLEYIEAHFLFDIPYEKIEILIHPQSVIHSMVEYKDGAVISQMASPDMEQPIQYALCAPSRPARNHASLDFLTAGPLTFEAPDFERFPCLALTMAAAKTGGTMPAMVNALNEKLTAAFLGGSIGFYDISQLIEKAMASYTVKPLTSVSDVEEAEAWAVEFYSKKLC